MKLIFRRKLNGSNAKTLISHVAGLKTLFDFEVASKKVIVLDLLALLVNDRLRLQLVIRFL